MYAEKSSRIDLLIDELLNYKPKLCIERAMILDESYDRTLAQPPIIRRAMALERIMNKMSIYILDGELIVGNQASEPRAAPIFPEFSVDWLLNEIDSIGNRSNSPFYVKEEDKDTICRVLKKWRGRTVEDRIGATLPEDIKEAERSLVIIHSGLSSGTGHMIIKYDEVLKRGLEGIIADLEDKLAKTNFETPNGVRQIPFYEAGLIIAKAAINFANRYADLAEQIALNETNANRRKELETISAICRRVPGKPARSFHEALQSLFLIQVILHLETNGHSISPGRFDQYVYPYYKADVERGVAQKDLQELLDCLWVKFNHFNKVRDNLGSKCFDGYPMFQNIIVGGVDRHGKNAVNELSYMCLEATDHVRLPQPSLSVRISPEEPDEFYRETAKVARIGLGMPAFFNDEVIIPALQRAGYSKEEARVYGEVGCVEPQVPATTHGFYTAGYVCFAKCLELALHNGKDPITNQLIGPETGDPSNFQTFEDLMTAYERQFDFFCGKLAAGANIIETAHRDLTPSPFASLFIDNCISEGKSFEEGGARYNFSAVNGVGMINAADSLAAIKMMVYDEKRITLNNLITELNKTPSGEEFMAILRGYPPKYGNDDDYVDSIVKRLSERYYNYFENCRNARGGSFTAGFQSISTHIAFSEAIGNMPDGKKFGEVLADGGVSSAQGRDRLGITALMKSVSKIDQMRCTNGTLFNVKMNPSIVAGEHGLNILAAIIKTFRDLKLGHVQFNIVSKETLLDAQQNPQNYSHLVVRVAGFSVFFTAICKELQEDIICRTEQN